MKIPASEIIIRPPVEVYSVLIAVTGGCSWNKCKFCGVYSNQDFEVRKIQDVFVDIDAYARVYPDHDSVFLAGGNATAAPTEFLVKVIEYVKKKFKNVKRISCYSKALDIVRKTDDEIKQLASAGLSIVYMGLESGSKKVLKLMKKGTNDSTIIKVGKRLLNAGMNLSLYVILGLGSYELSDDHVRETARVLTEINPTIFRFRTLSLPIYCPLAKDVEAGTFTIMKPVDVIIEERDILKLLGDNVTSKVFNDHISNYVSISSDDISKDKAEFIKHLNSLIDDPRFQKLEPKRLLSM